MFLPATGIGVDGGISVPPSVPERVVVEPLAGLVLVDLVRVIDVRGPANNGEIVAQVVGVRDRGEPEFAADL